MRNLYFSAFVFNIMIENDWEKTFDYCAEIEIY